MFRTIGTRSSMSYTIKLKPVTLACGLALGCVCSPARAARADHLAAVVDEQGRVVYVNAGRSAAVADYSRLFLEAGPRSTDILSFVRQASERFQLDPGLLHAVIRVESGYNPRAVSPQGAMGLMQLIPSTAERFGVQDPFDARQNIEGGATYLRYLLKLFSGDVPLSLAAYNAGEQSVLRSVRRDGGIPQIPETRDYVRKVTAAYDQVSGARGQGSGAGATTQPAHHTVDRPAPRIYSFVDAQGVRHFEQ